MKTPQQVQLAEILANRFIRHAHRHEGLHWDQVQVRLSSAAARTLEALHAMEVSGGEPDVIGYDTSTDQYLFCDCAPESPSGRRSLCYDGEALASRKENKPAGSACEVAASMGLELLTEQQYRALQALGEFDLKTSSWLATPKDIRALGGALFGDRRYGQVFVYHNGAQSYYAARGFRGLLRV